MPTNAAHEWLQKAAEDEKVVSILKGAGGPWSIAAYHVQQAAEKFIKAALVEAGVAPPKTHDLPQLLGLYSGAPPSAEVETAAAMISAYAWLTRYPGAPPIDKQAVEKAESDLALVKMWALSTIS